MRIDIYHHLSTDLRRCDCCDVLREVIARLDADLREFMTRTEVPQEVADKIGAITANVADNFTALQET